ncbi:MAG: YfhO family protein [Planctomycetes bacterium]|nr:YfhO family protein [Planctomycetota bacterium]
MMLSLGLKLFFNQDYFFTLIKEKHKQIIAICIALILLKIGISLYCFKSVYRFDMDLLTLIALALFAIFVYVYSRGLIKQKIFTGITLFLIFADISYYSHTLERFVLKQNWLEPILSSKKLGNVIEGKDAKNYFEYFRVPFVIAHTNITAWEPIAFTESIFKAKGALSRGNNHHQFTTKKYYDYMTHASLQNQFILSGVSYPILRFFPMEKVKFMPDKELLRYLETDNEGALSQYLFISKSTSPQNPETTEHNKFNRLDDFEDVPWLKKEYVSQYYADYLNRRAEHLTEIKENINKYLETPVYQLEVRRFSPNKLTLSVKNQQEGYLYYSDGWSRHWKAFDGKREIPVEIANYNFKAVHLQGGGHTIRFVYDPRPYRYSLIAYCVGLLASASICTAVLILTYRKERLG